ncbi:SDR family NAD(P)-dependent oxidoreductase [Arhodomonas sp. AD133]|uniref:SDR family NAD(P)-dependent oxidoreductase n=1 Tax=Arhodomonas sp. AD133 TaxID=3415009 RepID=UPI003EB916D6
MTENVIIVGSTSAVAQAVSRKLAESGARLYLIARNETHNTVVADDLEARGAASVFTHTADLADPAVHDDAINAAFGALPRVDQVLIAYGVLPDQANCETDTAALREQFQVNATSAISLLTELAPRLAEQPGDSRLGVITSVAGDRGRRSNYAYGAAKAALTVFASGLGGRYLNEGVHVVLIKLGFVQSPMTAGMRLPPPLMSTPEQVAPQIVKALAKGTPEAYIPGRWRAVMAVIKCLPARVLRRMKF